MHSAAYSVHCLARLFAHPLTAAVVMVRLAIGLHAARDGILTAAVVMVRLAIGLLLGTAS